MAGESIGHGSFFELHDENGVFVELSGVLKIGGVSTETEKVETTHLKSPGRFKEFIKGMRDAGSFTVEMNYVAGSATDILCTAADADTQNRGARISISDSSGEISQTITIGGFVQSYVTSDFETAAKKMATLTYCISGAPVKADAL